jgi:uncharacterized membrane protein
MISCITKNEIRKGEEVNAREIREGVYNLIKSEFPEFDMECSVSLDELNHYRRLYLSSLVEQERGELDVIDNDVINTMKHNSILTDNIEDDIEEGLTLGQRLADKIATFGGSWTFILSFFGFILFWIGINIYILTTKPFDPFPFILLNLILSCIASIQAPIIMMSQNRQEQKDRQRAEHDYKINLRAELEIKLLSEKIDHMIVSQNRRLLEIQQIQADYLEDLMKEIKLLKK